MSSSRRSRLVRHQRLARTRRQLQIQKLEDRSLMAVYTWTNAGADGSWTNAANWSAVGADSGGVAGVPDTSGDSVVFSGAGAGNVTVSSAVATDSIKFTGAAANYTLSGSDISLTAGGTITQDVAGANGINNLLSGTGITGTITAGSLRLGNVGNTLDATSNLNVGAGATLIAAGNTTSALGSANVSLTDGTLTMDGTAAVPNTGLLGQFFSSTPQNVSNSNPDIATIPALAKLLSNLTPATTFTSNINYSNGGTNSADASNAAFAGVFSSDGYGGNAPFSAAGFGNTDNMIAVWRGKIDLPAGVSTFATRSDDGNMLFIDGQPVVSSNFFQGGTTRTGNTPNFTTAGQHDIMVVFYEGTGGAGIQVGYKPAGGVNQIIPASVLTAGVASLSIGNNISIAGNSTINANNTAALTLGNLATTAGSTLNANSNSAAEFRIGGTTTLAAGNTTIVANMPVRINGAINEAGVADLTKQGTNTLYLNGTNTYSGVTTISQGIVQLGNAAGLGSETGKTVIQSGATLDIRGFRAGANGAEPIEAIGTGFNGVGAIINNGANQTSAFRNVTLLGDTTVGGTGRIDIRDTGGAATFNMNGFTLTKINGIEFCLVNTTITNPGSVIINGGTFRFESSTVFNAPAATITINNGSTLDFYNTAAPHAVSSIVINSGTLSAQGGGGPTITGTINAAGNTTISASNNITLPGQVTGAGLITKTGGAQLSLTNDTNNFSNQLLVTAGTLRATANNALGSPAAGTMVSNGATLLFDAAGGALNVPAELLYLTGLGVNGAGVLQTSGNNVTLAGSMILGSDTILSNNTANTTLTLNGDIRRESNGTLFLQGAGNTTLNGPYTDDLDYTLGPVTGRLFLSTTPDLTTNAGIAQVTTSAGADNVSTVSGPLTFGSDAIFSTVFGGINPGNTNFSAAFSTTLTVTTAGVYTFASTNNDDGAVFWIDLNKNGILETAGSAGNERLQGASGYLGNNNAGVATANLAAGDYQIVYAVRDTGGGSGLTARIQGPRFAGVTNGTFLPVAAATSGLNNVVKLGTGNLRIAGAMDYNGVTYVQQGTLTAASNSALGNSTPVTSSVQLGLYTQLWQLGTDNNSNSEFSQESGTSNAAPGSPTARDDDYYFAGTYPGIGTLAVSEAIGGAPATGFERALTIADPTDRIHFNLSADQLDDNFNIVIDTVSSDFGAGSIPIQVYVNEVLVDARNLNADATHTTINFNGAAVNATTGDNVIRITRGATGGAYTQFDYIRLNRQAAVVATDTVVAPGATLAFDNNVTIPAETVTIGGLTVPATQAVIQNVSGTNSFAGNFIFAGGSTQINSAAGSLKLDGNINLGLSNLVVTGAGDVVLNGAITGNNTSTSAKIPGLAEGRIAGGAIDTTTANPATALQLGLRMGQTSSKGPWGDNETWVYTGEFFDADGSFAFAENIDDAVLLKIDGVTYINNGTWNVATSTATTAGYQTQSGTLGTVVAGANANGGTTNFGMGPNGDGWHSFELRMYNGGGGAGASSQSANAGNGNWSPTYGIGWNPGSVLPADANGSGYFIPQDSGAGNLFRTAVPVNTSHILKQGAGTLSLNSGANTYTGGTIISQGTVLVGHPDALGSGTVTLNDASTGANNTALLATFANAGNSLDNNIVVANQGSGTSSIGSTTFNVGAVPTLYAGTLTLNKATTLTAGNSDRTTYTNVLSGNVGTLTVTGGARTTLQANNTFVGNVAITGTGTTLQVGTAGDQIPDASNLDVGAGTTFTLNADGEAINALTGSGTIQNIVGANTLTIGSAGGGGTFSGTFNNGSGALSVTKTGAGTQVFAGTGSTNNGATGLLRVQQGQLDVGGGFTGDGAWKGDVTIDANATLRLLQGNIFGNGDDFTVNGTLNMNAQSDVIGNLQGSGNVINNSNGSGIMLDDLSGTRTFTGNISGGGGFQLRGSVDATGTQVLSGGTYAFGLVNLGRGTLTLTNNPTFTATDIINIGHNDIVSLTSGSLTATLNIDSGSLQAKGLVFGNTAGQNGMTANGILNQTGGTVTTTGEAAELNSIRMGHWPTGVGTYNLSGGTLNVANGFALSTATDGTGRFIQTGGTANVQQLDLNSRAGTGGNGTFTLDGGTFNVGSGGIVRDDNNAPATINLGGGTLRATAQWGSPVTIPINITNAVGPAVIDTNGFTITLSGNLTGAGGVNKIGTGTLLLNGANAYSGATNVQVGTLGGNGSVTGAVNVSTNATLSPGGTPEDFATGALTLASGSNLVVELNGSAPGTGYDQVIATAVALNNANLVATSSVTPALGQVYTIISNTGPNPTTGTFNGLAEGAIATINGLRYYVTYNDPLARFGTGNDVALIRNRSVTPTADNFTLLEDGSLTGSLKANDTDLDLDGSVVLIGGVAHGTLNLNSSTGAFTYTPAGNWSGTESFQYWLNDGEFGSAANAVTVTINVTAVADQPSLTVGNVSGNEGTPIPLGIASAVTDTDGSESLSIVVSGVPAGATLSAGTPSAGGTVYTLTPAQLAGLTLTKDNNLPANAPFTLTVAATSTEASNGATATNTKTFSVTVKNAAPQPVQNQVKVDGVPQAGNPASVDATVGLPITFVVSTTDPAFANLDAPFAFSLNWGDNVVQTGTATAEGQQLSFTHDFLGKPLGVYSPKLTVTDVEGLSTTIDLTKVNLSNIVVVNGTLFVGGTPNADRIVIYPAGGGDLYVRFNNVQTGPYTGISDKVVAYGNAGNDTISTTGNVPYNLEFYGGAGNDYLTGGSFDDILDGGDGTDRLLGGAGNDQLYGGAGNDTLTGGDGDDLLDGDSYLDLVGNVLLPAVAQQGKDIINADAGDDTAYGQGGADTINGGVGNDFLRGGAGVDTISGDAGDDVLAGDADGDKLYGRDGFDVLVGGAGADTLYGSTGEDLMYGNDLTDTSDALLRSLAMNWAGGDQDAAANSVIANKKNDNAADSLYGEASDDWYLMFVLDKISTSGDAATNRVTNL
jgi:autotransporter-associated beta strand protein